MSKKELVMDPVKKDLLYSLIVGLMAGPLALITVSTLELVLPFGIPNWSLLIIFPIVTVTGILVGRLLGRLITIMYKFVKFGEVGGLNWLVDLGVINLLVLVSGVATGWLTVFYKAVSFSVAVVNSYLWNKNWVFSDAQKQDQTKEASKFLIASLLGLAFNLLVFSVVKFGGQAIFTTISATQWVSIATVVGSLSAMIFNFVLYKIWVFKD